MTDIKDPRLDQLPPPYECLSCGFSTWSWNEAKKHICASTARNAKKEKPGILEAARSLARPLRAVLSPATMARLIELLGKAGDGSTGEFKESTVELASDPGQPLTVRVKRGTPVNQQEDRKSYHVVLEIAPED